MHVAKNMQYSNMYVQLALHLDHRGRFNIHYSINIIKLSL
jgi:hypothetical protein